MDSMIVKSVKNVDLQQSNLGCILAGGKSSRMGKDKALMSYNGKNFLEIAEGIFNELDFAIKISCRKNQYPELNFSKIYDENEELGPVGGLISVLSSDEINNFTGIIFLPVDMPLLTSKIIKKLIIYKANIDAVCFENSVLPLFFKLSDNVINVAKKISQ
jgi:molybdopterin-guanine dinucleotide biosynthesis protein A